MATMTFFFVAQNKVAKCGRCGGPIYWQQGRRSVYPTDVLVENGQPVTSRTNFHKCNQAEIDALRRASFEEAGQQSFIHAQPKLDMSGVNGLFDKAIASGLKYPKIRLQTPSLQPVALSRAGNNSKYKGQVMVTDGARFGMNKYFGRVDLTGTFHPAEPNLEVCTLLARLGSNPAEVASGYGKLTGNCCFCLRRLDDERSVVVGYGPVCARHFGLPWG